MNGGGREPFLILSLVLACVSVVDGFVNEAIAPLYGCMCMRSGAGPGVECLAAVLLRGCKELGPAGCLGPGEARGTRRRMDSVREPRPGSAAACVAPHLHAVSQFPTPWGGTQKP